MDQRALSLRHGEAVVCELLRVVRDHHQTMPGTFPERPGIDRVLLRMPDGSERVVDVYSRGHQPIAGAPRWIEVRTALDVIVWRPAGGAALAAARAANEPALPLAV